MFVLQKHMIEGLGSMNQMTRGEQVQPAVKSLIRRGTADIVHLYRSLRRHSTLDRLRVSNNVCSQYTKPLVPSTSHNHTLCSYYHTLLSSNESGTDGQLEADTDGVSYTSLDRTAQSPSKILPGTIVAASCRRLAQFESLPRWSRRR